MMQMYSQLYYRNTKHLSSPREGSQWAAAYSCATSIINEILLLNMGRHNKHSPHAAALYIHHKSVERDYFSLQQSSEPKKGTLTFGVTEWCCPQKSKTEEMPINQQYTQATSVRKLDENTFNSAFNDHTISKREETLPGKSGLLPLPGNLST